MEKFALLARVQARPGKEQIVFDFLKSALAMAEAEPATVKWYAFKINENTFGVFDTFETEDGRSQHLQGEIAKALMANADTLFATPPVIEFLDLLAVK
jgi:quinol monooxygenase YgiN